MFKKLLQSPTITGIILGLLIGAPLAYIISHKIVNGNSYGNPHVMVNVGATFSGSATYIGNGYFITASHVVTNPFNGLPYNAEDTQIQFEDGTTKNVKIIESLVSADIAILRTDEVVDVTPIKVDCSIPNIGDKLKAYGNPWDDRFVYTNLEIVGKAIKAYGWDKIVPVDGTVVWGMSGGGVLDKDGELMGITVGVMIAYDQAMAFGYIVPAYHICELIDL